MRTRILLLIGLLAACSSADKPKNLIPQDEMVKLLGEIHIIENQVNNQHLGSADSSLVVYKALETRLFKQYKIDTSVYLASFKYYVGRPEEFKGMYEQVVKNLEIRSKQKTPKPTAGQPKKITRADR